MTAPASPPSRISLVVSDVDGTLVKHDKSLAPSTIAAAARLRGAGIRLAIVSSRPPRGMAPLAKALDLDLFGGFNGSTIVDGAMRPVEQHFVPEEAVRTAIAAMQAFGAEIWVFDGEDWLVTDPAGAYVAHERRTVQFDPTVVPDFNRPLQKVGKVVGASDDFDGLARLETDLSRRLGKMASARRSQRYYLDVTNPTADKGHAVRAFAAHWSIPLEEVAVLGDMANDIPMFEVAGFSIAMGNAPPEVQARANATTAGNDEDGWAKAIDAFVLPAQRKAG